MLKQIHSDIVICELDTVLVHDNEKYFLCHIDIEYFDSHHNAQKPIQESREH